MVKSYLRYSESACLGVVCSGPVVYDRTGERAIVAALSAVLVWNLRTGEKLLTLHSDDIRAEVTALRRSPDGASVAAGYGDGSVRVWSLQDGSCALTFQGHRKGVTALCYTREGNIVASASKDTDIVLWDVVAEAGQCRLQGHKDAVTDMAFLEAGASLQLLSCSKDTLAKVWDVETRHCTQTLVGHRSEIWSLAVSADESRVVTAGSDSELRVWGSAGSASGAAETIEGGSDGTTTQQLECLGTLPRASRARVMTVRFDEAGAGVLAVHSADKAVELFRTRDAAEVAKKHKRKEKRRREKAKLKGGGVDAAAEQETANTAVNPALEYEQICVVRADSKIRAVAVGPRLRGKGKQQALPLLLSLGNNQLEQHDVLIRQPKKSEEDPSRRSGGVHLAGHRADVRAVALSSDDELLLSTSHAEIKLWNLRSQACIRTIPTGYGLCGLFLPGDRQVVVGTKSGQLELYDLGAATRMETIDAHAGAVWALGARPAARPANGQQGGGGLVQQLASGSADHDVKFWDIELKLDEGWSATQQRVTLACVRTLTMQEDVLALKYSPDAKLLAVSLLDATVKVFYEDSLKFFLSLYGHKLPVMSLDISFDSRLIATGSADKNIKIWGLDFGDCHKSLFAHTDAIMALAFIPGTHYLFSGSKDRVIKYWDCDKFEQIVAMEGHRGEVWSMAISQGGGFMVSAGHDRSIRVWDQTQEQVFLDEEREKELEAVFDADVEQEAVPAGVGVDVAKQATTSTAATLKDAERLAEALSLAEAAASDLKLYRASKAQTDAHGEAPPPRPPTNPLLLGLSGSQYLLRTLKRIPRSALEEALIVLPLKSMLTLFGYFDRWLRDGLQVELVCRCLFFALRMYHDQLTAARMQRYGSLIESLGIHTRQRLARERDTVGYNLAGLRHVAQLMEAREGAKFFDVDEAIEAARERGAGSTAKRKRLV